MLTFIEFCKIFALDKRETISYIHYGMYCRGYGDAVINYKMPRAKGGSDA